MKEDRRLIKVGNFKKLIFREIIIFLLLFFIVFLLDLLCFSIEKLKILKFKEYLDSSLFFMQLLPIAAFFYPSCLFIRLIRKITQNKKRKFVIAGFLALISGIFSFLWASLMYISANMDFINFSQIIVLYFSPVLIIAGVICVILALFSKN